MGGQAAQARSLIWLLDFNLHSMRHRGAWHMHKQKPLFLLNNSFLWAASSSPDTSKGGSTSALTSFPALFKTLRPFPPTPGD